jgi:type I restriction enzyme M protein
MSGRPQQIVAKLRNYCKILQDDALPYGDYLERLTILLFLKIGDEQSRLPWPKASPLRVGFDWPSLPGHNGISCPLLVDRRCTATLFRESGHST